MMRRASHRFRIRPDVLLKAYTAGVFPMAESTDDPEVFWIRPEIRGIIPLDTFHIPKSLAKTIRHGRFTVRFDSDFEAVIDACAEKRVQRLNSWINTPIREAYIRLHRLGHCHSVEAWSKTGLAGGLYGVSLGRAFFGESMFSRERDASKVCLVHLVEHLRANGFTLLDTQFTTEHLKRFGAIDIERAEYEKLLAQALEDEVLFNPDASD